MSTVALYILLYSANSSVRSGLPGAYAFTGSFTAMGTSKNPFPMIFFL